jgi:chemotaxis protein methyltransferase CheR
LPALLGAANGGAEVRVWSAGCASGEEPYTLAMVLAEEVLRHPGLRFQVQASDISHGMLAQARTATYTEDKVEPVPLALRQRYLLRRRDGSAQVRIVPHLRERVRFRHLNLLDSDYALGTPQEVIFCRNVFIYFSRETQAKILDHFIRVLSPGGYLFLGHSETISGFKVALTQVAPTVYRKADRK